MAMPFGGPRERPKRDRVDRRHLEPRPRLHEGQPRLQALLRGDLRRAVPRGARAPVRAGLRPAARSGQARGAAPLADPEADLRELDERPVPGGRPDRLHRRRRPGHGAGRVAHLPGAHEAARAHAGAPERRAQLDAANLPHVWLGVSVEDRRHGLPRIGLLRATPAAVRFLSIEPLLEDLGRHRPDRDRLGDRRRRERPEGTPRSASRGSGRIRNQCRRARVPFFFKQWGGVRKSAAGRRLRGRTYDEFPRVYRDAHAAAR